MPDVFLSYGHDDVATARHFAEGLERAGFSVWWDATLRSGDSFDAEIEAALRSAKAVLVLWSRSSVQSRWVRAEATLADRLRTFIPVMIETCERPLMFELTHTADLTHWSGAESDPAWQALRGELRERVGSRNVLPPSTLPAPPPTPLRKRRLVTVLVGVLALLLIAGAGGWLLTRGAMARKDPLQAGVSLAVLPFVDMSPDHNQDYFSDGLSEELMNQLAQIKGLRLTARTSSFAFKGRNEDVRVIGQKLDVDHVLEGSVRKAGNRLRITAHLINSRDGTDLWSRTYDRDLSDVFAIQEEIAMQVSDALSVTLDVGELSRAKGGTANLEAYDRYLQGLALERQLGPQQSLQGIDLFREAVKLDPGFARAWAALADTLSLTTILIPQNATAVRQEAAAASARVMALAPDAWWAQAQHVQRLLEERKWIEASTAAAAAEAAAPSSATVCSYAAFVGRVKESLPCYQRTRQADPLNVGASLNLQTILDMAGRPAEAQVEYDRSRKLAGDDGIADAFAVFRVMRDRTAPPAALKARFDVVLGDPAVATPLMRTVADNLQNREAALAAIRGAFADPAYQNSSRLFSIALFADHFGDKDLALAAMRRAFVDHHEIYAALLWYPYEMDLHADPRFRQILRDLGLADYFRSSGEWGDFCMPAGADDFACH